MSKPDVFFPWSDSYYVNIHALDTQHKELASLLNCLFNAAFERKANKVVVGILQGLQSRFRTHFEHEESLLQRIAHKDLAAHQRENQKLLSQLDALCRKHEQSDMPLYFDMLYFLKHWLEAHFRVVDSKDLVKGRVSTRDWEQSANEAYARIPEARRWCFMRKAA